MVFSVRGKVGISASAGRGAMLAAAGLLALGVGGMARGQSAMPMMDHSKQMSAGNDGAPSTQAFEAVAAGMHKDMAIEYTGEADVDFVQSMIPHHQGAIDMAKVELEYGTDPQIRQLAEEVIKAQEAEIAMMREWLAARGN